MAFVRFVSVACLLAVTSFVAVSGGPQAAPPPLPAPFPPPDPLVTLVRDYERWSLLTWPMATSTVLCTYVPPDTIWSVSLDETTHGKKRFHLYARDGAAYLRGGLQPEGQTLVKKSWHPPPPGSKQELGDFDGFYVMHKEGGRWTYAVTTPDGSGFRAQGRIESCANCHEKVRPDGLFGVPR